MLGHAHVSIISILKEKGIVPALQIDPSLMGYETGVSSLVLEISGTVGRGTIQALETEEVEEKEKEGDHSLEHPICRRNPLGQDQARQLG